MCFCYAAFLDQFMLFHKFWRVSYYNPRGRGFIKIFDNWWTQLNLKDTAGRYWLTLAGGRRCWATLKLTTDRDRKADRLRPRPPLALAMELDDAAQAAPQSHRRAIHISRRRRASIVFLITLSNTKDSRQFVEHWLTGMIFITNHFEQQSFVHVYLYDLKLLPLEIFYFLK